LIENLFAFATHFENWIFYSLIKQLNKMELQKVRESLVRTYSDGEAQDRVDNVTYQIIGNDGVRTGEATAYNGSYNVNISGNASSVEEAVKAIEALFNTTISE
jgi:hypothetical protein